MNGRIVDFIRDERVIDRLEDPEKRLIMVLGGPDTGKTTLAFSLSRLLCIKAATALVDLDMGQSRIGPPTTVGWAVVREDCGDRSDMDEEDIYFTGSLSPAGSLLPAVTGAKLLVDGALERCRKVVVDTTGLVSEPAGRVLKHFKIDLLRPDIIIALERHGELSRLLEPLRFQVLPEVIRVAVPDAVVRKDRAQRIGYREERFRRYFSPSRIMELPVDGTGVRFTRERVDILCAGIRSRIVSLRDSNNRDRFLGVIKRIDVRKRTIHIQTPAPENFKVSTIVVGSERAVL